MLELQAVLFKCNGVKISCYQEPNAHINADAIIACYLGSSYIQLLLQSSHWNVNDSTCYTVRKHSLARPARRLTPSYCAHSDVAVKKCSKSVYVCRVLYPNLLQSCTSFRPVYIRHSATSPIFHCIQIPSSHLNINALQPELTSRKLML
jgi:hypothetical protein